MAFHSTSNSSHADCGIIERYLASNWVALYQKNSSNTKTGCDRWYWWASRNQAAMYSSNRSFVEKGLRKEGLVLRGRFGLGAGT